MAFVLKSPLPSAGRSASHAPGSRKESTPWHPPRASVSRSYRIKCPVSSLHPSAAPPPHNQLMSGVKTSLKISIASVSLSVSNPSATAPAWLSPACPLLLVPPKAKRAKPWTSLSPAKPSCAGAFGLLQENALDPGISHHSQSCRAGSPGPRPGRFRVWLGVLSLSKMAPLTRPHGAPASSLQPPPQGLPALKAHSALRAPPPLTPILGGSSNIGRWGGLKCSDHSTSLLPPPSLAPSPHPSQGNVRNTSAIIET